MTISLIFPGELRDSTSAFHILDTRPYSHYLEGHIPGAVWMGWDIWCEDAPAHAGLALKQPGYWGILKNDTPEALADTLGQFGVSNDRPVLIYADGPRSKGREARVAWMLLYFGLPSVSLLNGGWSVWLRQQGDIETSILHPSYSHIRLDIQEHRRVRLRQLLDAIQYGSHPLFIDTRSYQEYIGQLYDYQPRLGRIPEAIHMPYTDFFDDEGYFVTRDNYLRRLPSEVRFASQCVPYCEVGVRSCLFALLHELYAGQVIANFDGSLMEWSLDKTLPMNRQTTDKTFFVP